MDTITPLPLPATLPVAGISFRQDAARSCTPDSTLTLEPEPGNRYDEAAIRVTTSRGGHLGYIPAALNRRLGAHPLETLTVRVEEILDSGDIIGLRIRIGKGTHHSAGGAARSPTPPPERRSGRSPDGQTL